MRSNVMIEWKKNNVIVLLCMNVYGLKPLPPTHVKQAQEPNRTEAINEHFPTQRNAVAYTSILWMQDKLCNYIYILLFLVLLHTFGLMCACVS